MNLALYPSRVRSSDLLGAMRAAANRTRTRETKYVPPRAIITSPFFDLEQSSSILLDHVSPKLLSRNIEFSYPHFPLSRKRAKQVVRRGLSDAPTSDPSNDKELREIEHCRVT
jgi:alpha-beta hydrolase superfamily lysophospholipase